MATFGGFIASALGGAAKGYGEGAQMEMKKQAELDLKKQLMEAELEKASRLDEITSGRIKRDRLEEETRLQSPAYLKAQADAEVGKVKALMASGLSEEKAKLFVKEEQDKLKGKTALLSDQAKFDLAAAQSNETSANAVRPILQRRAIADAASADAVATATAPGKAKADAAVALIKAQEDAKATPELMKAYTEKFNASKVFEDLKASEATAAQIKKAKELAADPKYMEALAKTDRAMHAGIIRVAEIKAQGDLEEARARAADKAPGGGSTNVGLELDRAEKSAEKALARALGVEVKEANGAYIALKRRADGGDAAAKAKLAEVTPMKNRLEAASAEWEARKKATAAAPAAAASGAAASSFTPAMPPGFKGAAPPPPSKFKLD